jgi:hypothetical protein
MPAVAITKSFSGLADTGRPNPHHPHQGFLEK